MGKRNLTPVTPEQIKMLIDTALGEIKADIVVANADLVNVYSGELLKGYSVAIKGEKIAYVGEKADHTIGPDTRVIDAAGKTLIPGFIDAHTHLVTYCTVYEFLRYAMKGGITTIITETTAISHALGYQGVKELLEVIDDTPIKIFATISPTLSLSPAAKIGAITPESIRRLLKHKRI